VIVETVQRSDLPLSLEYPARVAGSRVVQVRARVTGVVIERTYREGQPVKAGDVLFRIEPDNYRAAYDQAAAQAEMQKATIAQSASDLDRAKTLVVVGGVSRRDYDQAETAALQARAGLAAAEAAQKIARRNLDYTVVRAPVSGVASKEAVTVGNIVNGSASGGGDLLTTIVQADPAYVEFSIAEAELLRLRALAAGNSAQSEYPVRILRGSLCESHGKLDFADSFVNTRTGTVRARAVFPNESGCLVSGQSLAIELGGLQIPNVLSVSKAAVLFAQAGPMVWVVGNDKKVSPRPVRIQESWQDRWILQEGVQPGERVIVEGLLKVKPGAEVVALTKEQDAARKTAASQNADGKDR
jgi:membrane fusion protein, multidrug efflux system